MGLFVRKSTAPSDKYGAIVYYVDSSGFVRKSSGPSDKYGAIEYYVGNDGFIRRSTAPSDKYGAIVYYIDDNGFVRKSNGPSDKYGAIVYYVGNDGFVRRSTAPSDKYGAIVYYVEKEKQKEDKPELNQAQGAMLAIAFVIGLLFAPILIILGMFGKFLLGGIYKNATPLKAFQKFRKIYSIISLAWMGLGIAGVIVTVILGAGAEIALYALVGGNVLLFILSIVIGNKIYNEHKHELPQPVEETASVEICEDVEDDKTDIASEDVSQEKTIQEPDVCDDYLTKELLKYKNLFDNGLIDEREYKNLKDALFRNTGIQKNNNFSVSVLFLWICSIFNFLGIFINMMICLGVWGDLHHMYSYILYGYIAGFSFIAICTPVIIGLSIALKKKAKSDNRVKNAITAGVVSIALTTFLMILSIFL